VLAGKTASDEDGHAVTAAADGSAVRGKPVQIKFQSVVPVVCHALSPVCCRSIIAGEAGKGKSALPAFPQKAEPVGSRPCSFFPAPERKQAAEEILEALELTPFIKQHPSTLSGGQKQRLALGVALMHEAPIIVLDEPTSGLDGTNMRNVSRMIRKLAKMGRTIIVITHDAECALACCERAIRLENGCITDDFQIRGAELLLDKIGYDKKEG